MGKVREVWIDKARGVGIILVVFGHAWRGLYTAGLSIPVGLYRIVDSAIYAFHMPFFFLLAGLFLERGIAHRTAPRFVADRVLRLIWPLMLWTWIFFAVKVLAGGAPNNPQALADFPIIPLPPQLHFWFLWALFLIQLAVGLIALAVGPLSRQTGFWVGLLAVSIAGALWIPMPAPLAPWLIQALVNAPFVLIGVLVARSRRLPVRPASGAIALVVFVAAIAFGVTSEKSHVSELSVAILAILALIVMIHVTDATNAPSWKTRWLSHLGRISMAIYLSHTIFSASLRSALLAAGVEQVWLHLAIGLAGGLAGPAALEWAARRLELSRALGF